MLVILRPGRAPAGVNFYTCIVAVYQYTNIPVRNIHGDHWRFVSYVHGRVYHYNYIHVLRSTQYRYRVTAMQNAHKLFNNIVSIPVYTRV